MSAQSLDIPVFSRPEPAWPTRRIKTLVVDDSPIFREFVCFILEREDRIEIVDQKEDGHEAIEAALIHHPDLIIMDIQMPCLDGLAATSFIARKLPWTRVVLMSGEDTEYMRRASVGSGAAAFIPKIDFTDQIEAVLARLLGLEQEPLWDSYT